MTTEYLVVALLYLTATIALLWFEHRRTRAHGLDPIAIFIAVCILQCGIPGIIIFGALPFVNPAAPTGAPVFDRVLQTTDVTTALLVLTFTVWFVISFYLGAATARLALGKYREARPESPPFVLSVRLGRLLAIVAAGTAIALWSFSLLGSNLLDRYSNLILLRGGFSSVQRTALNANALSLTQTFGWLSLLAVISVYQRRGRDWLWVVCLGCAAMFALLGVSRRAIFLPLVLAYLAFALYGGRWRLRWVVLGAVPLIVWVAYGKTLLAAVAFGGTAHTVASSYNSWLSGLLRAGSDAGITIVESLGSMRFLHVGTRFGVDHLLSVVRRFPNGTLGVLFNGSPWQVPFPQRIVRMSTTVLAGSQAQDIPPGLLGQMWIDFGFMGPVVWGIVLGLQTGILQFGFERVERTLESCAIFVLLVFVVALPLNSGSFDFTFSIDIFLFLVILAGCATLRHSSVKPVDVAARPSHPDLAV